MAYPRLVALLIQSYWMYLQRTTSSHNANEDEGRRVVGERFVTFVDRWAEIHGVTDETDRAYLAILQQSIRT